MLNELLGNEITVGREHMCRDAERHADALRYVDGLLVECIELSLRNMPGNEIDGPLHWRLRKGREKLRAAVESLERGYLVEVPNAAADAAKLAVQQPVMQRQTGGSMNDKELLEAAARAAGIDYDTEASKQKDGIKVWWGLWLQYDREPNEFDRRYWNPLTDDGDALRLAVKLRFCTKDFAPVDTPDVVQAPPDGAQFGMVEIWRQDDDDPIYVEWYKAGADRYAATRRAIVRAAAAIGSLHNAESNGGASHPTRTPG